jgi:hypothetical protein
LKYMMTGRLAVSVSGVSTGCHLVERLQDASEHLLVRGQARKVTSPRIEAASVGVPQSSPNAAMILSAIFSPRDTEGRDETGVPAVLSGSCRERVVLAARVDDEVVR